MESGEEITSFELIKKPDTPGKKKHTQVRIVQNGVVGRLVAWGGAFAFACVLAASTFKRNKKRSARKSRDGEAQQLEGLRLLLQSTSTDFTTRSCRTTPEMSNEKAFDASMMKVATASVKHDSVEGCDCNEDRTPPLEFIEETEEGERIVAIIYEEEYADSEKYVENRKLKDHENSEYAEDSSFGAYDEATWLTEWTDRSSEEEEEDEKASSRGVLPEKMEGDDEAFDIIINP